MTVPDATPEALAEEVCPCDGSAHNPAKSQECYWSLGLARAVLASSWLAQRDNRMRAGAWDEGYVARLGDTPLYKSRAEWGNPYREAQS